MGLASESCLSEEVRFAFMARLEVLLIAKFGSQKRVNKSVLFEKTN